MSTDFELAVAVDAENPVAHDLKLTSSQITLTPDQTTAVAQHLRVRLQFFLGEWFLDLREGVPYYRDILKKNPSQQAMLAIFRRVILDTPGIEALNFLNLRVDRARRRMDPQFSATLQDGEVLEADFGEFVVEVIS